jgi:predicted Rossmann fold flavoprotein
VIQEYDVVVLGAGAAGLMCAIEAGKRGRRVAVLDHAERPGKKILISGGGRCNFTNLHSRPENFLSANPHFARAALARYTPADFIAQVERHGIRYHEKTLGQLFCDGSAREIVAMLLVECEAAGAKINLNQRVESVSRTNGNDPGADGFTVRTQEHEFRAQALVVATGGLSIPKMGATGFGYEIARQFGVGIEECRPALVPLILNEAEQRAWCDLSGISAEVVASVGRERRQHLRGNRNQPQSAHFREKLLVTHRGLSGPAVLQISSYWREGETVKIDWVPGQQLFASLLAASAGRDAGAAKAALREVLPARLAERVIERLLDSAGQQRWTNAAIEELERQVHDWEFTPAGTEGYEKAEVTAGGVATSELDARTMEAKRVPGLYFIGEVVDVTGHLGGHNFQWAWASGAAAGRAV